MQDFGLWDVIVSTFWFMLLLAWIWLIISILSDIFRDHELSGWGKAWWTLLLIFLPWLGALIYLIARGRSMADRQMKVVAQQQAAQQEYIKQAAGSTASPAGQIADARALLDSGAINQTEFDSLKAKALA